MTSLNLHQNFKWVLCVNHTEPVKNYLVRYLERLLIDQETRTNTKLADLEHLINWLPKLWLHVNKYIELYNSVDLTLGPRVFTTFPADFKHAFTWFAELWNEKLVPMLIDTIREGVQVYGTEKSTQFGWEDPRNWLESTLPWLKYDQSAISGLYSIDANEIDLDLGSNSSTTVQQQRLRSASSRNSNENDKLINMLMRLQEATGIQSMNLENELMQKSSLSISCQKSIESSL